MTTKERKLKIQKGDIWLVDSDYTWGGCLITIDKIKKGNHVIIIGKVIATENPDDLEDLRIMDDQVIFPHCLWAFKKEELICKIG